MKNREILQEEFDKAITYLLFKKKSKNFNISFWKNAKLYKTSKNWEIYIHNKLVVVNINILELLKILWLNPRYGGVGIDRFYNHIKTKYWGITKKNIKEFLNNLESYQLHKRVVRAKTINPIPKELNYYYQIDLIDMSKYSI